jgi:Na+/proline symporter
MFSWYHLLIIILPVLGVCVAAWRCRRYVRSVTDFLVAGRCAGRYVLLSGGMMGGLSVVTFVGNAEVHYHTGYAMNYWNQILLPMTIVMGLFGWISYRFRETRAMSCGQFLEMRYSRGVRRLAAILRGTADALANCIGPAVAVRFLIYLLGIPHRFDLFGHTVPTFPFMLAGCLCIAVFFILCGGRISLLVTDAVQGLVAYPIFVIMCVYIFTEFSWTHEISAVMADRVPGESFMNPYDISELRDFNLFALVVTVFHRIFGGAWVGNGYGTVARSPHEQKMAGITGNFGNGFSALLPILFVLALLAVMNHKNFANEAHQIRQELSVRVSDELSPDHNLVYAVGKRLAELPVQRHEIGVDPPLSRAANLDTPYLNAVHETYLENMDSAEEANKLFQGYRTTYMQQMLPMVIRNFFPRWLTAMLVMLCILLVVSTDDTRIFDSSNTWVQDFILPFFKKPPSQKTHLLMFKSVVVLMGVIFWCGSYFLAQMDYINMFVSIACSIWIAGAGVVVTGGLYWRRGTAAGAYAALAAGGLLALIGLLVQRNWQTGVYPWLVTQGWDVGFRHFLEVVSSPFNPWIDWRVSDELWPVKFPINSTEIGFIADIAAYILYFGVSLATCREPFNLERLLHRGQWAGADEKKDIHTKWTWKTLLNHFVSITPEYSRGDKIITWFVFFYTIFYKFLFAFIGAYVASKAFHWGVREWSQYFFVITLAVPFVLGIGTTVWFTIGSILDIRRLFRDLEARKRDALDNGMVDGHVSLADKAAFAEKGNR